MLNRLSLALALAAATAIVAPAGIASAKTLHWTASLTSKQEVDAAKPVAKAHGKASGTLNTTTNKLTWDVTWAGLSGPAVAMHFHGPAGMGKDAGVEIDIGKASGLKSPSKGSATITADQAKQLQDGMLYINVHTKENPKGEIRGQVMVK